MTTRNEYLSLSTQVESTHTKHQETDAHASLKIKEITGVNASQKYKETGTKCGSIWHSEPFIVTRDNKQLSAVMPSACHEVIKFVAKQFPYLLTVMERKKLKLVLPSAKSWTVPEVSHQVLIYRLILLIQHILMFLMDAREFLFG